MNETLWQGQSAPRWLVEPDFPVGTVFLRPWGVVRVSEPRRVEVLQSEPESDTLGCVAGWISEED